MDNNLVTPKQIKDLLILASKYFNKASQILSTDSAELAIPPNKVLRPNHKDVIEVDDLPEKKQRHEKKEKKEKKDKKESREKKESKKLKKKTGYNLYMDEKIKEFKDKHEGEKFNMIDISKTYSKEWNEMDNDIKDKYKVQAEEYNYCLESIEKRKTSLSGESVELSDTGSEGPRKKAKSS